MGTRVAESTAFTLTERRKWIWALPCAFLQLCSDMFLLGAFYLLNSGAENPRRPYAKKKKKEWQVFNLTSHHCLLIHFPNVFSSPFISTTIIDCIYAGWARCHSIYSFVCMFIKHRFDSHAFLFEQPPSVQICAFFIFHYLCLPKHAEVFSTITCQSKTP